MDSLQKKQQLCRACTLTNPKTGEKYKRNYFCGKHGQEWRKLCKTLPHCEGWGNLPQKEPRLSIAVVITSHNYGRYLPECIESVLNQTCKASEIIVVDDASTDDTREAAERYEARGVRYGRVDFRNVHKARRAGIDATKADVVLFVDADDILSPDYLECGLAEFTDHKVGVVYADHQHFGVSNRRTDFPEYSFERLMRGPNFVSTCSMVRREALNLTDAWDIEFDDTHTPADYWLFQRVAMDGWDFRKQKSVLKYRRHRESMSLSRDRADRRMVYYLNNGLHLQTVTLFVPLSGRKWMWERFSSYLERQTWPHDQIKLILLDTSGDAEFNALVKEWVAGCDYPDVRHIQKSFCRPGLSDLDRRDPQFKHEVNRAMCRIYNELRRMVETNYCWILEDDIIPPVNVLKRLLICFNYDVGAVTAPYQSRFNGSPVVWINDGLKGIEAPKRAKPPEPDEDPVTEMRGSGFGCLVLRSDLIRQHIFALPRTEAAYDPYFFKMMGEEWRRLCDWTCAAEHWEERGPVLIESNTSLSSVEAHRLQP